MTNILDSHINLNTNIISARRLKSKPLRSQITASNSIVRYDLEKVLSEQEQFRENVLALNRHKKEQKKRIPAFAIITTALLSLAIYKKVKK